MSHGAATNWSADQPCRLDGNSGGTRRFLAPRYGNASVSESLVDAVCISSTGNVAIYLDTTLSENQEANVLANLGRLTALRIDLLTFLITTRLGAIRSGPHDGRLSILITELDCQDDRAVPILGCVRPSDFLGQSDESSSEPAELSDVVYLDESLPSKRDLTALLAHELAHAAVDCRLYDRRVNKQVPLELPEWLHEGIAHHQESLLAN